MSVGDWDPTFNWNRSLAAFDDKAELQEFEPSARKLTFTIAFRKGQWLAEMGRKRAFTEIWRMAGLGQKRSDSNVGFPAGL